MSLCSIKCAMLLNSSLSDDFNRSNESAWPSLFSSVSYSPARMSLGVVLSVRHILSKSSSEVPLEPFSMWPMWLVVTPIASASCA